MKCWRCQLINYSFENNTLLSDHWCKRYIPMVQVSIWVMLKVHHSYMETEGVTTAIPSSGRCWGCSQNAEIWGVTGSLLCGWVNNQTKQAMWGPDANYSARYKALCPKEIERRNWEGHYCLTSNQCISSFCIFSVLVFFPEVLYIKNWFIFTVLLNF